MRVHVCTYILCGHFFVCLSVHTFIRTAMNTIMHVWGNVYDPINLLTAFSNNSSLHTSGPARRPFQIHWPHAPSYFPSPVSCGFGLSKKMFIVMWHTHSSLRYYLPVTDKRKTGVVWKEEAWSKNSKKTKMPDLNMLSRERCLEAVFSFSISPANYTRKSLPSNIFFSTFRTFRTLESSERSGPEDTYAAVLTSSCDACSFSVSRRISPLSTALRVCGAQDGQLCFSPADFVSTGGAQ
jgi:ribosomal protein L37E